MKISAKTVFCVSLVLLAGCSESVGDPSLTFTGIGSPGLSLDDSPVNSEPIQDTTSPIDATDADSPSDSSETPDTTPGPDAQVDDAQIDDAGPDAEIEDAEPDTPPECLVDTDCDAVLGEALCQLAICSDEGVCEWSNAPEAQPCDDGDACTFAESCVEGECQGQPLECESENPCVVLECDGEKGCIDTGTGEGQTCDDGDSCSANDMCVEGQCTGTPVCECKQDADCVDDGNLCNGVPFCDSNVCVIDPLTVVLCEAGTQCTQNSCNPDTGSCEGNPLDGKPCDAGNCLQAGACQGGACEAQPVVCDDDNGCTSDSCDQETGLCAFAPETGEPCDDGNVCTLADSCQDGACAAGPIDDCNDGKPCTFDSCAPDTGCAYKAVICDDGSACTDDSCAPGTGCVFEVISCDDQNACTNDTCVPEGEGCVSTAIVCDDESACTEDSCSPETGCVFNAVGCDDGNACTVDACSPGQGCEYSDLVCDDGDLCTAELCQPDQGCLAEPIACSDGFLCTTDTCASDVGCVFAKVQCPDAEPCQVNQCEEATGDCISVPLAQQLACDDGDVCTTSDQCSGGQCTGKPLVCDDQNECTKDYCGAAGCAFDAVDDVPCDEGNPCTLGFCTDGACDTIDPCDDFDDCTLDSCSAAGECSYAKNPDCIDPQCEGQGGGISCNDGNAATSADMCIDGECAGFLYEDHDTDPNFGSLSFDNVTYSKGVWSVSLTTFGANADASALLDATVFDAPAVFEGTTIYGSTFRAMHGRFAITTQGDLWEFDGLNWNQDNFYSDLLNDSGSGQLEDVFSVESDEGTIVWVVGRNGLDEYIRRCDDQVGCLEQYLDRDGFGNSVPLPRAVAGYLNCEGNAGCVNTMEMGVDSPDGNDFVSHTFGNKDGKQEVWTNTFLDPGDSDDETLDIAAYGDGRFLVVGKDGYMRYRDLNQWQNALFDLPGNEASRTFTGVWIGADVVIVSAWRVSNFSRVLELWTTSKDADPQVGNNWTVHTLDSVYGGAAGLFDVWGLENGTVKLVGSGRQTFNGYQQGLVYTR